MITDKATSTLMAQIKRVQALGVPYITYEGVNYQLDQHNRIICLGGHDAVPKNLYILEGTNLIETRAFNGAPIEKVYIPDTVSIIGDWAFAACQRLAVVRMGPDLHYLGDYVFSASALRKLDLRGCHVPYISDGLCMDCRNLQEVWCPMETERIEKYAFYGCNNLEKIHLPNRKIVTGQKAFYKGDQGGRTKRVYYPNTPVNK